MEDLQTGVVIYSTTFNVASATGTVVIFALVAFVYDWWSRRPGH